MQSPYVRRSSSLEHDVLKCVLDQEAVGNIIDMGCHLWGANAATTWDLIQQQAALGRLRAYRGDGSGGYVDPMTESLDEAKKDFTLWVEPTERTFMRINEFAEP